MKFLRKFNEHTSYEAEVNVGGDFKIPNVSYCKDVKDVHFNPYNLIKFYVGEITGTTQQTVSIYTDETNHVDFKVSEGEGKKWYSYLLPKDKGLYQIVGDSIKNVVIKANISYSNTDLSAIISNSTVEASFKGSDTSNVTNMNYMFYECTRLTSLDLSGWNTSKVTNMRNMFYNCSGLKSLDVSRFDTSNVTNMGSMFDGCSGLASLDVSNFNTSKVTDMSGMFYDCDGLTSLDLRNFNTSNVTNMNLMFNACSKLTSLDLSNFNTSNVTNMNQMFNFCSNLTSLDLRNFKTSKVTSMSNMFSNCSGLTSLDLSKWDISEGTSMLDMFSGCSSLRTIKMIGCKQPTIDKIKERLTADGISLDNVNFITK